MRFAEKLYTQMALQGLNQQKLARRSLVSDSEVSRILAGKSQPGLENAFKLATAVGVSLDYLADDALDEDPGRGAAKLSAEEQEVHELIRGLGLRQARRLLEISAELGQELAIRRLLGVDARPAAIAPTSPAATESRPDAAGHSS